FAGCDAVVNCAFASSGGFRASRLANLSLIQAVLSHRNIKSYVHLSSIAVYGRLANGKSSFKDPQPATAYGREKEIHERHVLSAAPHSSTKRVIIRLGHVYGAEQMMSRFIFESIAMPSFRLPFGGEGVSNCVSR